MQSTDEPPIPPGDGDPPRGGVRIFSVSPIAGALAGGITVTLTGTGFQPEAEVFFGSNQATGVVVESDTNARATLPPATDVGSVNVSLVNPDGTSATRAGGFTYVVTGTGAQAEVLGVTPLSVIEDTESDVTLRGHNLVEAHTNGMLALRGPGRVQITSSLLTSGQDEAAGLEELTFTVRVVATPPLEQHERVAIQVLASVRPGSQTDGIPESSRKMFTVLPRAVPVPIAFTNRLEAGKPNLVVVAGRNLEGCTLSVGEGATLHVQRSDEQTLVGLVTVSDGSVSGGAVSGGAASDSPESAPTAQLSIHKEGSEVARFDISVAPNGGPVKESAALSAQAGERAVSAQTDEETAGGATEPEAGAVALTLAPMPGQQIFGPTAQDSSIFKLGGGSLSNFVFDFVEFDFVVFERSFTFSLFNEVRVIPFFDGGEGDALSNTPVKAQVGKLFRLRGMGLLVALRVELVITIEVVIIIGFRFGFDIWDFGLFNEFYDDYPFGIGSIVITFRLLILIDINFNVSFMVALIRPGGQLRVLYFFNLSIEVDFTISTDGRTLHFDPDFDMDVDYTRIGPRSDNLRPCGGHFQLADDNGQTEFTDASGDHHSFYFVHEPGECCLPWDFNLRLVRFRPGSDTREVVQDSFRADFCLNAAPSPVQLEVVVVSDRTPTGYPPPLVLDVTETASLRALGRPRGNPVPTAELRDVRDLGYQVEFYIEPSPDVLDKETLRQGTALAQATGENTIHARLFKADVVIIDPETGEELPNALWPDGVLGFDILSFLARGLPPAVRDGSLPVEVNAPAAGEIVVNVKVARRDTNTNKPVPVSDLVRNEPFDTQQQYVLAAKVSLGANVQLPQTLTFDVSAKMAAPPLKDIPLISFERGRGSADKPDLFFSGEVFTKKGTLVIEQSTDLGDYLEVTTTAASQSPSGPFSIQPNNLEKQDASGVLALVPPGRNVAGRDVKLTLTANVTASSARVRVSHKDIDLTVSNEETFEEYLRVFQEVQEEILDKSPLTDFASKFNGGLKPGLNISDINDYLAKQGVALWKHAVNDVQTNPTSPDDRPLYWTRLRCIAALRAYFKSNGLGVPPQSVINQFEFPSRGLAADGSISFSDPPVAGRKAVFTGFDPFGLPPLVKRSNPSGLAALAFHDHDFGGTNTQAHVRTAVLPVRYDDFDRDLIEGIASTAALNSVVMFLTCSDNSGREFYDIERWAGKMRGTGLTDNNRVFKGGDKAGKVVPPGGTAAGGAKEFLESTLPYELVIATPTDTLPGPKGSTPFVMDQSYSIVGANPKNDGEVRSEPEASDTDKTAWFTKLHEQPKSGATSLIGSGGNYLSNEIFYRVALARGARTLPTGHLHVPSTEDNPTGNGPKLISGVTEALNRLLDAALRPRLQSITDLAFPKTLLNRSQTLTLTATNSSTETITVKSADVASPFTVTPSKTLPAPLAPGETLTLTLTFQPTDAKKFVAAVRLRNSDDKIVLACTLTGEGISTPPAPQITSFDPTSGLPGDDVTITGTNLDDTSEVKIAKVVVPVSSFTSTQVVAEVAGPPRKGKISLTTPGGTATSAGQFTVLRQKVVQPPEELGAQLKARREELGIGPRDAAQQLGVTPRTYTRWERGQDTPSVRYRPVITRFLGHDPAGEPQTLGERIRTAREREGLSVPQLARRLKVSSSAVRAWEADSVSRPTPRLKNIFEDYVKGE